MAKEGSHRQRPDGLAGDDDLRSRCSTACRCATWSTSSPTCASSRPASPATPRSRSPSRSWTTSSAGWARGSCPRTIAMRSGSSPGMTLAWPDAPGTPAPSAAGVRQPGCFGVGSPGALANEALARCCLQRLVVGRAGGPDSGERRWKDNSCSDSVSRGRWRARRRPSCRTGTQWERAYQRASTRRRLADQADRPGRRDQGRLQRECRLTVLRRLRLDHGPQRQLLQVPQLRLDERV